MARPSSRAAVEVCRVLCVLSQVRPNERWPPGLPLPAALLSSTISWLTLLQAAALLQSGALSMGQAGAFLQQRMQQRMEPPLGGRLARRPLDPQAEAERRAQQEKLYSLDIIRIRSGASAGAAFAGCG